MSFGRLPSARLLTAVAFILSSVSPTTAARASEDGQDYGYGRAAESRERVDVRDAGRAQAPRALAKTLARRAQARVEDAAVIPASAQLRPAEPAQRPDWLEQERLGPPYQADGVWYAPTAEPGYSESGLASWYGAELAGRRTASGETFDPEALTGAHPTLPLPSLVQVTNLETGAEVIVRINDRGPFTGGRIIDVSQRAAQVLGFERAGEAKVHVRYLGPAPRRVGRTPASAAAPSAPRPSAAPASGLFVQVGAFGNRANADRAQAAVRAIGQTQILDQDRAGRTLHLVRIGPLADRQSAERARAAAVEAGFDGSVVLNPAR